MQVVEKVGPKEETWDSFLTALPNNEYRFCVFDFEFTNNDHMLISKLVFINWDPDNTPLKAKVLYATAKENFKKYLDMHTKDYTISSPS
jgi:cofilin